MLKVPAAGKPVRGSKTGVPIMVLFDLLSRRWAMGVIWTLCQQGPCTFRDLQSKCGTVSPAVLNTRLKELREAALVKLTPGGYRATVAGQQLYGLLNPLGAWSKKWVKQVAKNSSMSERI